MKKLTSLFVIGSLACMLLSAVSWAGDEDWQNLFNGKTLNGWIQRNGKAKYTVEDGMIVGTTVLNTPNSFLCTEKMYTDFILELEYLVEPGMNSGIQIRSNSFKHYKNYRVHGYQVEIDTSSRAWSGGIYDEARRGWLFSLKDHPAAQRAFKQNQWNHYRIEAIGDRIRTWVNGVPAADLKDDMTSTGFIALQVHGSKEADKQIKWRNIRIQDLTRKNGPNNHDWKGAISGDYKVIEEYDFGKSREALAAIEKEIRNLPRSSYGKAEAKLLPALESSKTSFAGKQFVCRMLRRIGSAKSVPALAGMLSGKELSHMARFALQFMPAPEAGVALRDALNELDGDLKIGVVGSLGQRGDREAVGQLARLVTDRDRDLARAAIGALGRIGGAQAAGVLGEANVPASLQADRDNAYLMCADSMLDEGQTRRATAVYREMISADNGTWIRIAAYKGLIKAEKEKSVPHILALLKDDDIDLQRAAGKFIAETPGAAVTTALAEQLESLGPDAQVVLLSALEGRGDNAAAPYVAQAVAGGDERVRLAAIRALAVVGGAENVKLLTKVSVESPVLEKAAMNSLARLSGPLVRTVLSEVMKGRAEASVRINAIETLVNRHDKKVVSSLLWVAQDDDAGVRQAAYKALGALADQKDLELLVSRLLEADSSRGRSGIERAMVAIVVRTEEPSASAVVAGLAKANNVTKPHLLTVLSRIGDDEAFRAVRSELRGRNADVRKAAVRALADWPNPAPLSDLMEVAKTSRDATQQILAVRGYIKLLGVPANRSAAETVGLLGKAMEAAQRSEEKKAVLAALPKYPCEEAIALAEKAMQNAALRSEAELAAKKTKEILLSRNLKAQASRNGGNAKSAVDGKVDTRWDTGRPMKPGDWFVLDLGAESVVRALTLDAARSPRDYPRGYEVYVSFDGGSWGRPVVTGKGAKPITEITFDRPVRTRFIKIVQTGSSDSWHWSIHELTLALQ